MTLPLPLTSSLPYIVAIYRAIRFTTLTAICRELGCQPGDLLSYDPEPASTAPVRDAETSDRG